MILTARQSQILQSAVLEYVNLAVPVSSQLLEEKYDLAVSPATIRNEMKWLEGEGFLIQPHISAGRVPTDKGYRFFVDSVFHQGAEESEYIHLNHEVLKNLAAASGNLAFVYVKEQDLVWKEGWERLFQEPEFEEKEYLLNLARFLRDLEKSVRSFQIDGMHVYIGKENPFSRVRDFSIIISRCAFEDDEQGLVSIIGPKRMAYQKNIGLIKSPWKNMRKSKS